MMEKNLSKLHVKVDEKSKVLLFQISIFLGAKQKLCFSYTLRKKFFDQKRTVKFQVLKKLYKNSEKKNNVEEVYM